MTKRQPYAVQGVLRDGTTVTIPRPDAASASTMAVAMTEGGLHSVQVVDTSAPSAIVPREGAGDYAFAAERALLALSRLRPSLAPVYGVIFSVEANRERPALALAAAIVAAGPVPPEVPYTAPAFLAETVSLSTRVHYTAPAA